MDHLQPNPPTGFFINPKELKYVKHLGYLHNRGDYTTQPISCDATQVNSYWQKYDPTVYSKVPVGMSHGYIKSTWTAIKNQFMLFDHPPMDEEFPHSAIDWAEDQIVQHLEENEVESSIIELEQVEFTFMSSSGFYWNKLGNKGEILTKYRSKIDYFMDNAVRDQLVPLWKLSGKEEYQKFEKINEEDQRCFEIPPVDLLSLAHCYTQSFNKQLYTIHENSFVKVGISFDRGGFNNLLEKVGSLKRYYGMGDCRKFDKWLLSQLLMHCMSIRLRLYKGPDKEKYRQHLLYLYQQAINTPIITPWGQVLMVINYMKSGYWSTTPDNTLSHFMIVLGYIKTYFPGVQNFYDCRKLMEFALYSDDHLFAAVEGRAGRILTDFANRRSFYAKCGLHLKEEDDYIKYDGDWEGITFLGAKAIKTVGGYAPQYNIHRIWSAIVYDNFKTRKPYELYSKVYSLLVLSTFNGDEQFNHIRNYLKFLVKYFNKTLGPGEWYPLRGVERLAMIDQSTTAKSMQVIPDIEWCRKFWMGYEAGGLLTPSSEREKY
jgi:hypothetical protein